jgi:hypothetical protein
MRDLLIVLVFPVLIFIHYVIQKQFWIREVISAQVKPEQSADPSFQSGSDSRGFVK